MEALKLLEYNPIKTDKHKFINIRPFTNISNIDIDSGITIFMCQVEGEIEIFYCFNCYKKKAYIELKQYYIGFLDYDYSQVLIMIIDGFKYRYMTF